MGISSNEMYQSLWELVALRCASLYWELVAMKCVKRSYDVCYTYTQCDTSMCKPIIYNPCCVYPASLIPERVSGRLDY